MKGKGRREGGVKESPGRGRKRPALPPLPETGEEDRGTPADKLRRITTPEENHPIKTETPGEVDSRVSRLPKQLNPKEDALRETKLPMQDRPSFLFPPTAPSPSLLGRNLTRDVGTGRDVRPSPRSHGNLRGVELMEEGGKRGEKAESPPSLMAECKSELSDRESSQVNMYLYIIVYIHVHVHVYIVHVHVCIILYMYIYIYAEFEFLYVSYAGYMRDTLHLHCVVLCCIRDSGPCHLSCLGSLESRVSWV